MTRTSTLIAASVAVLALAGCGSSTPKTKPAAQQTITVSGALRLFNQGQFSASESGKECAGGSSTGYGDIVTGAQVVIYDSSGKTLAASVLRQGFVDGDSSSASCRFAFSIDGVPVENGPYSVEVSHRGKIVFTQAQASDVELSLGS